MLSIDLLTCRIISLLTKLGIAGKSVAQQILLLVTSTFGAGKDLVESLLDYPCLFVVKWFFIGTCSLFLENRECISLQRIIYQLKVVINQEVGCSD